jgi:hypothetical protein
MARASGGRLLAEVWRGEHDSHAPFSHLRVEILRLMAVRGMPWTAFGPHGDFGPEDRRIQPAGRKKRT